jgi:membrane fusion protein (multidrug efflux system)
MSNYMKILIGIFVFSLATIWSSCGNKTNSDKPGGAGTLQVEAYKVIPKPFNNDVVATAELLASEQVDLMAPISGQVLEIYFKEGEHINKGEAIIRLDDRNWKAQTIGVKAELDAVQKDYDRKKALLAIEGSSQEEVDRTFSTVETLKSQLQQLQVNIDLANVTAPFSGQLGMRNFSQGAFLKAGEIITTLTGINQLKVDFTLAQENQKNIEIGKEILVLIERDTLKAKIYAINPIIDAKSRTINVRALLLQNADKIIMPGTFAEVLVTTNFVNDALLIPTQAVVPEINEQTVYLYKSGKAVRKTIQMGNRTAENVQVLNGIAAGDTVVTSGLLQIKNGMDLQIKTIK